jgi:hypothetical protein
MTLSLSQSHTLRQCHKFECPVCKQDLDDAHRRDTAFKGLLFGAEDYAVCPSCFQEVSIATFKDKRYRKRVDKFMEPILRKSVENAFLDMIDAHYGTSIHHIGDGDGIEKKRADELRQLTKFLWARRERDEQNR